MPTPTNLAGYYSAQGQALPSLSAREQIYQQQGLGNASTYSGSAAQNASLLSKLMGNTNIPQITPQSSGGIPGLGGGAPLVNGQIQQPQPYVGPYAPSYYGIPAPAPQPTVNPYIAAVTQPFVNYFNPAQPELTNPAPVVAPVVTAPQTSDMYVTATNSPSPTPTTPSTPKTPERTFKKIGLDIYETTNGTLQHVTDLASTGLNKTDPNWWSKLQSINVNTLSETEKQLVNRVSTDTWGQPVATTQSMTPAGPISGREITQNVSSTDTTKMTSKEFEDHINEPVGNIIHNNQPNQNAYTSAQPSNGNNGYYKSWNTTKNTWDLYSSDGVLQTSVPEGINMDHVNTPSGIASFGGGTNPPAVDPTKLYSGTDPVLQKKADDLQKDLDDLKARDPFSGKTIDEIRTSLNNELKLGGEGGLYEEGINNQSKINEIVNTFEKAIKDVRGNVNLPTSIKIRRLANLESQQQTILNPLIRNQDIIDKRIGVAEKTVTERLGDMVSQYNIYRNQVNDVQDAYDKLTDRMDDQAKEAKQAINTLITNPELLKDITQSEIDYISKNGTYPASLITKIGKSAGVKAQTVFYSNPTANTKQAWVVYEDPKLITKDNPTGTGVMAVGNSVSDVTSSGSAGTNTSQITVDTGGTQYRVTYDNMGNEINRTSIGASNKAETPAQTRNDFGIWMSKNKDLYTEDQLQGVAAIALNLSKEDVKKDNYIMNLVKEYKTDKGGNWLGVGADPQTTVDPVQAFTGTLMDPKTGESYPARSFSTSGLQEALAKGWVIR